MASRKEPFMEDFDRRSLLRAGMCTGALTIASLASPSVHAKARTAGAQAPGFYRFRIGSFQATVLTSGMLSFNIEELWPDNPKSELQAILDADFQPSDAPSTPQINVLALNTGDRLALIDLGSGGKFFETGGALPLTLSAAGIRPDDVDTVIFTHAHPD